MVKWIKRASMFALVSLIAVTAFGLQHSSALAYGHQDQPLAQIEFSGNCDNPSFFFCSDVVGTGGIWLWIEIDTGGTGDVRGAECGHTVGGVGGPGGAGAGSVRGDVTWSLETGVSDPSSFGAAALPGIADPNGSYYLVTIPGGEQFLFPATQGHYSFQPAPGVTLQLQIAP